MPWNPNLQPTPGPLSHCSRVLCMGTGRMQSRDISPGSLAGAEMKIAHVAEEKNPVVLGRLGREPGRPTILFYGHYDVQPAMERDWRTDPFELNSVDGYLYGRGTSDNKVRPRASVTLQGQDWNVQLCECRGWVPASVRRGAALGFA